MGERLQNAIYFAHAGKGAGFISQAQRDGTDTSAHKEKERFLSREGGTGGSWQLEGGDARGRTDRYNSDSGGNRASQWGKKKINMDISEWFFTRGANHLPPAYQAGSASVSLGEV